MDEKMVIDLNLPREILFVMIKRNSQVLIPRGETRLLAGDTILIAGENDDQLEVVKKMATEELEKPISILNI
jgi:cell volume regulation protein A